MAKDKCVCKAGAPGWMVTFGDLMSLLLTFFVLLLSFAEMDVQKFKEMSGQVSEAFGVQRDFPVKDIPKGIDMIRIDFNPKFTEDKLMEKIKSAIKTVEKGKLEILKDMRGIVLKISDKNFFDIGKGKLRPNAWPTLDTISMVAKSVKNDIRIESHTDDIEYKKYRKYRFKDSWDLSANRVLEVARYFESMGDIETRRLLPVSMGDSVPLYKNDSIKHRKLNRRLEIIFIRKVNPNNKQIDKIFDSGTPGTRTKSFPVNIFNLGD